MDTDTLNDTHLHTVLFPSNSVGVEKIIIKRERYDIMFLGQCYVPYVYSLIVFFFFSGTYI